jgi:phosphonate transport system substrate-binding protein
MRRRELLNFAAMSAVASQSEHVHAAEVRRTDVLRVGLTAVILVDQAAFLTRWSRYLGERTGASVVFVARESYQNILDLLFSDQLDAAWVCGYPYVLHQHQLRMLATPMYAEKPLYQSYLIGRLGATVPIQGWADLKQRVLAYSDPLSNSGWLVPQDQLRKAGISPRELQRSFFAHGHRNVAEAVAAGLAQAGCIDGYVWETMKLHRMSAVTHTEVLWRSEWYAFPPIVSKINDHNPSLQKLNQALQNMTLDPDGLSLLSALNLTGFGQADAKIFAPIKALAAMFDGAQA